MLASFFSPHMTYGDLLVGIGTLALAFLTRQGLATAKESASAAERGADAANASAKAAMIEVDALTLPFVVLTPDPTKTLTNPRVAPAPIRRVDNTHVEAQLLNIGAGAAIVTGVSIVGDGGELLDQSAQPQRPLAAQGYDNVRLQTTNTWLSVGAQLTMSIKYQAPDGRRLQTVTMASLQGNGNDIVCHSFARRADEVPQSR